MAKRKFLMSRIKSRMPIFDYFDLSDEEKKIIAKVCSNPHKIKIAPLDKGLSGAKTLLGQIHDRINDNISGRRRSYTQISKLYVFKIGIRHKIEYEYGQMKTIAERIIQGFPPTDIAYSRDKKLAIIKQEFLGDQDGKSLSLKRFIEEADNHKIVFEMIDKLYNTELINWNVDSASRKKKTKLTYNDLLKDWMQKGVIEKTMSQLLADVGDIELEKLLVKTYGLNFELIQFLIDEIKEEKFEAAIGPVHGDLHAENILISKKINLIDFGWTDYRWKAVDFIWLECSLKYVVCTPSVGINSYLRAEDIVDSYWNKSEDFNFDEIVSMIQGQSMAKIVAGIIAIRKNIKALDVLSDLNEYRKGLVLMSYSLLSLPRINKIYLIHSICNNLLKIYKHKRKEIGHYDILYGTKGLLWPDKPGRMVEKAVKIHTDSGVCLDIGCGDGKNIAFLRKNGWTVEGIDNSFLAIQGARHRLKSLNFVDKISLMVEDCVSYSLKSNYYDFIVSYGLYHCLDDSQVIITHKKITNSLKRGGVVAFAMLNDTMPIPFNHGTSGKMYLRGEQFVKELIEKDYDIIELYSGEIEEDHLPVIGKHKHGVTWGLFRKK